MAPTLVGTTPAEDATQIATGAYLAMAFDEAVQTGSGKITIRLASDGSVVEKIDVTSGAVSTAGSDVTINPAADLLGATAYDAQVVSGAMEDLAGNAFAGLSGSTDFNFTTALAGPTESNAVLIPTGNSNAIDALGGKAIVRGLGGDDSIEASAGNDAANGGAGNNFLRGAARSASLYGGVGNDHLFGGGGRDLRDGGAGDDLLNADAQIDRFMFGTGSENDEIREFADNQDTLEIEYALVSSSGAQGTFGASDVLTAFSSGSGGAALFDFQNASEFLRITAMTQAQS